MSEFFTPHESRHYEPDSLLEQAYEDRQAPLNEADLEEYGDDSPDQDPEDEDLSFCEI